MPVNLLMIKGWLGRTMLQPAGIFGPVMTGEIVPVRFTFVRAPVVRLNTKTFWFSTGWPGVPGRALM